MDFFDEVDALDVVENHAKELLALEEAQALKILGTYRTVAEKLRRKLRALPYDSFSAQQARVVLAQVEQAIVSLGNNLESNLFDVTDELANKASEDLVREINLFEETFRGSVQPIPTNAVLYSSEDKNFLFNKFDASKAAYSDALRQQMAQGLSEMLVERVTPDTMVDRMSSFFLGEEWRLRRIVRTEMHGIYGGAKQISMENARQRFIPDLKKTLYHPVDGRTGKDSLYAARLELIVPIDAPFKYTWAGKQRKFMHPPDRPNDRSIMIPYRQEWA